MPYTLKDWKKRYSERSDLCTYITHLTRPGTIDGVPSSGLQVLCRILKEKRLNGSTTNSGFVVGDTPAVCFQDAPPSAFCQNTYYEQKYREVTGATKVRYSPIGLMFPKDLAYRKGARPVIYDRKDDAKRYLPSGQWWRIVNLDLSDADSVIDWSHEREWRCPTSFEFDYCDVVVVLVSSSSYQDFMQWCCSDPDEIHLKLGGIIVLDPLLR